VPGSGDEPPSKHIDGVPITQPVAGNKGHTGHHSNVQSLRRSTDCGNIVRSAWLSVPDCDHPSRTGTNQKPGMRGVAGIWGAGL